MSKHVKNFEDFVNESHSDLYGSRPKPKPRVWNSPMDEPNRQRRIETEKRNSFRSAMNIDTPQRKENLMSKVSGVAVTVSSYDNGKIQNFADEYGYDAVPLGNDFPYTWDFQDDSGDFETLKSELTKDLDDYGIRSYKFE